MFGKVKKWLGIEGVKLEISLAEEVKISDGKITGSLQLQSLSEQKITKLTVRLVEKYRRGRKKEMLTDEYQLGEISMEKEIIIFPENGLEIDFDLPFNMRASEVDAFGNQNLLTGGLASLAKMAYAVNSEFRVEAEAEIAGVALNPFAKKSVILK